jgi:hypothetical protein
MHLERERGFHLCGMHSSPLVVVVVVVVVCCGVAAEATACEELARSKGYVRCDLVLHHTHTRQSGGSESRPTAGSEFAQAICNWSMALTLSDTTFRWPYLPESGNEHKHKSRSRLTALITQHHADGAVRHHVRIVRSSCCIVSPVRLPGCFLVCAPDSCLPWLAPSRIGSIRAVEALSRTHIHKWDHLSAFMQFSLII